jgi:hypothetical protein
MEINLPPIGAFTVPDELTGPLPRKVRISSGGLTTCILAYALLAMGIALVLWVSVKIARQIQYETELRSDGREAVGEITRYWSSGKGANWHIGYSFSVDGVPYRGEARVPENLSSSLGISLKQYGTLSILYLPANPSVNYPPGWDRSYGSYLFSLIPSLGMVIIGIALLFTFSRDRQLIEEGAPSAGVITNFIRGKGRTGDAMCYEFRLDDGRIMSGSSQCDVVPEIGASICILYLPQNPQRNQRYPLRYYRLSGRSADQ